MFKKYIRKIKIIIKHISRWFKNFLRIIFVIFIISFFCSTPHENKLNTWCEDVFIPGNKYYKANIKRQKGYEIPPVINAKSFLPKEMVSSDIYKVKKKVYSDGTVDYFQVKTNWGEYRVAGILKLKSKINEINAIESLKKINGKDALYEGVMDGGMQIANSPSDLLKTSKNYYKKGKKRVKRTIKKGIKYTTNKKSKEIKESKKENINDTDLNIVNERLKDILNEEKKCNTQCLFSNKEVGEVGKIEQFIGVKSSIVDILKQFNIEPDTENMVLRYEISRVAKIRAGAKAGFMVIPALPVLSVFTTTKSVVGVADSISAYDDKRTQLRKIHKGLIHAGCNKKLISEFEKSLGLSTYLKTIVVNYVLYLKDVKNTNELIKISILIDDDETALMFLKTFSILPSLYDKTKFQRFIKDSPLPAVVTNDNKAIILFAGDHLYWVRKTARLFNSTIDAVKDDNKKVNDIEAWILGFPSSRMKRELRKLGIKINILKE